MLGRPREGLVIWGNRDLTGRIPPIFVVFRDRKPPSQVDISGFVCYMPALRVKGQASPALRFTRFPIRSIERGCRVQVLVRDNNVDQALKALKKKMQREGIFREMKLRGHYEKPSEK